MIKALIAFLLGVGLGGWVVFQHQSPQQVEAITEMLLKNLELATENFQLADQIYNCKPK
jgi:uncharacterized protein HemX